MGKTVYGIDLGTTNSAIAVYRNDEAQIIKNLEGGDTTPSVVYFTGVNGEGRDESVVGAAAKEAAAEDPAYVIQSIKRFMGRPEGRNLYGPSGQSYTPEMISALILKKVCQDAERYEGAGAVKDVVITVPAYFDDAARVATRQAGKIAGLNVLRVLNEPTAAAIAFGVDASKEGKVLVYDLGGGTFDVTIMDINGGRYDVLGTDGNAQLGGLDFDRTVLELIQSKLQEQGIELDEDDDELMVELQEKAERVKKQLTTVETVRLPLKIGGKRCQLVISRAEFEQAAQPLLLRTELILEEALERANLTWADITDPILVGGSTRMPMVKQLLERLSGKEIPFRVNPDLAVAVGAAIFAGSLCGEGEAEAEKTLQISDVTSQSLGVITLNTEANERQNTIVIPKNTKIPAQCAVTVYTIHDQQEWLKVEVTEGDDPELEYVKIIGSKTLSLPPYPKEAPVEITYAYDADQTVVIQVTDLTSGESMGTFQVDRVSNLSEQEVQAAAGLIESTEVE